MAFVSPFCPEDDGGPVSQKRALELIELMHQRALEGDGKDLYEKGISKKEEADRYANFHLNNGIEQALSWAKRLLERVFVDASPESTRKLLLKTADELEAKADSLRTMASYMEKK